MEEMKMLLRRFVYRNRDWLIPATVVVILFWLILSGILPPVAPW